MLEVRRLVGGAAVLLILGLTACDGDGNGPQPTPTPTPTVANTSSPVPSTPEPTPTQATSVEDEVAEAYLAYWEAYAEAVLNLDISFMEGLAAGEELERIRDQIERLSADGLAARLVIEHDFAIVSATATSAVVIDEFVNNSFLVDAETKDPSEGEGSGEVNRDTFFFERIDGLWVVTRSTREPS